MSDNTQVTVPPFLDELVYCIDSGFSAPVTERMLLLVHRTNDTNLALAYAAWNWEDAYEAKVSFEDAVEELTSQECFLCGCDRMTFTSSGTWVGSGEELVCDDHCLPNYSYCNNCEEWVSGDTEYRNRMTWCESCWEYNWSYCEYCDGHYHVDDEHDFDHEEENDDGCDCVAPIRFFNFPANGHGTVISDQRLTVQLPAGTIDNVGIQRIKNILCASVDWYMVDQVVDKVGPEWHHYTGGNFTKRLGRALYKQGVKLEDGVVSQIGNIARQHSSSESDYHVEFTRDLNAPAAAFCHDESCWWSSNADYCRSRCSHKSWGGLGLRIYRCMVADDWGYRPSSNDPSGRAWIQPLNAALKPTHDTMTAHAYIVFNAYGDLDYNDAARIVSHLTSKTYKKVQFTSSTQYINNNSGYLVADEATCNGTNEICFDYDHHSQMDARAVRDAAVPARTYYNSEGVSVV